MAAMTMVTTPMGTRMTMHTTTTTDMTMATHIHMTMVMVMVTGIATGAVEATRTTMRT